jgi:hypothetical protein
MTYREVNEMSSSWCFILTAARDQSKLTHDVTKSQDIETETECCHEGGGIVNDASVEQAADVVSHGGDENLPNEDGTETVAELLARVRTMQRYLELERKGVTDPSQDNPNTKWKLDNDAIAACVARIKREQQAC